MPVTEPRGIAGQAMRAAKPVPVRGTQSFVGVFGQVWRRPGLLGLELLWRWGAGVPLLLLGWHAARRALAGVTPQFGKLDYADFLLKPAEAAAILGRALDVVLPPLKPIAYWVVPLGVIVWTVAAALGRTWTWRQLDPQLRPRPLLIGTFGLLRILVLLLVYAAWLWGMAGSEHLAILQPAQAGREPNLVLYTALAVGLTLLLFMVWSLTSWVLDAAPLFAMAMGSSGLPGEPPEPEGGGGSFRAAVHAAVCAPGLASKLIETNLVMGIIKVALLVLAMVFSASPLPFVSVETPAFLRSWWSFVGVLFVVSLDLFQVVRRAAYLQLFRALVTPEGDTTPDRKVAS